MLTPKILIRDCPEWTKYRKCEGRFDTERASQSLHKANSQAYPFGAHWNFWVYTKQNVNGLFAWDFQTNGGFG